MQTNFKPAKGSAKREAFTRKEQRRIARDRVKREQRLTEIQVEKAIRIATFERDKGRCRAYGFTLRLVSDDPYLLAHCHHMTYRSAGGSDEMPNRITLSPLAHSEEHAGLLHISGDPNGTLYFTLHTLKGRIVRAWESSC